MDLLSLIGSATKKRGGYFSQAKSLAKKVKTIDKLESLMWDESKVLVEALRDKQIRWEEYSRTLTDKTIVSALVGVYLGAGKAKPSEKMEKAWPNVVGSLMPPLVEFLNQTETRIDSGILLLGQKTFEFADYDIEAMLDDPDYMPEMGPGGDNEQSNPNLLGIGRSWLGVFSRVVRYLANPAYSFFALGDYYVKEEQGFKEMRRVARLDKKTCKDCVHMNSLGWNPLGSLPMPGQDCRCHDRCRCRIEYR
jgi:hypothetical protein